MATHTWADLHIAEAKPLADLCGMGWDLRNAIAWARQLNAEYESSQRNYAIVEPLSIAALVAYSRPFMQGVRRRLRDEELSFLTTEQLESHRRFRAMRDKHIAHSVNEFEGNQPRANYCVERVQSEGITSVSCIHARISGLGQRDLAELIDVAGAVLGYVEELQKAEQTRLLEIVRAMPIDEVLAGGQSAFDPSGAMDVVTGRRKQ